MLPDVAAADRDVLRPWAAEEVMAVAQALVLVLVSQQAEVGVKGVARLALGGPASGGFGKKPAFADLAHFLLRISSPFVTAELPENASASKPAV